jgi:hypothetical protein
MSQPTKDHISEIGGSLVSSLAVLTSWQENVSWAVSLLAALVAITAGLLTIRSLLKKSRAARDQQD